MLKDLFKTTLLLGCLVFTSFTLCSQMDRSPQASIQKFISTLSDTEKSQTLFSFNDTLRKKWTNLPVGLVPRSGIRYGALSDTSRLAFHHVLASVLSSQGYLKTTSIMQLDDILNALYKNDFETGKINAQTYDRIKKLNWDHGNFFISIWGQPSDATWGLNFGGHHIAISVTSQNGNMSMSPYFVGTDPSEVKSLKYAGLRILSKEEDYGFMLVNMLTEQQKKTAVLNQKVPGDIITSPGSSQRIETYYGLLAKEMTKSQQEMLRLIIKEYTHNFAHDQSHRLSEKIEKSGMKKTYFAWIGSLVPNKPHYYIIHSPDILIEYDNVGFQNDGNHIHAIFREKGNDFGEDILKKHYLEVKH